MRSALPGVDCLSNYTRNLDERSERDDGQAVAWHAAIGDDENYVYAIAL